MDTTYITPNVERVLGYTTGEIVNVPGFWLAHMHPDDLPEFWRVSEAAFAAQTAQIKREYRFRHKSGEYRWLRSISVLGYDAGRPISRIGYLTDITESRQDEEGRRLHDAALADVGQAVVIIDMSGRITYWNRFAESLFGWSEAEALGRDAVGFLTNAPERGRAAKIMEGLLGAEAWSGEFPVLRKDGSTFDALVIATPVYDASGNQIGVVSVSLDLTKQKAFERELRQASQAKSEFLSRVSHELRTPLSIILGFNELLQLESLPAVVEEYLREIGKAGQHLLAIVDDVLDLSRIEAGNLRVSMEPVDLADVVGEVASLMRPLAEERDIHLEARLDYQSRSRVNADRQRLVQVLVNLVSNAIKYNRAGGRVWLACQRSSPNRLRLSVEDTGFGIPLESRQRLFSPFDRLDAGTSSIPGSGLGLSLSKHLVELMGGAIGVESASGNGSTFWVELEEVVSPSDALEIGSAATADNLASDTATKPELRVVYIEDNLAHRVLIERLLTRQSSVRLLPAIQGRIGLELVRQHRPDLVLLDMHLPDINGEEVLAELQADPATAAIPVVVLSADATPRHVQQIEAMGVRAYLTKPIDVRRFLAIVDEVRVSKEVSGS